MSFLNANATQIVKNIIGLSCGLLHKLADIVEVRLV